MRSLRSSLRRTVSHPHFPREQTLPARGDRRLGLRDLVLAFMAPPSSPGPFLVAAGSSHHYVTVAVKPP